MKFAWYKRNRNNVTFEHTVKIDDSSDKQVLSSTMYTSVPPENNRPRPPQNVVTRRRMTAVSGARETWSNRAEFILILIGYTIGLGNAWWFPFLCHKNGGASFLIPYFFMLAIIGIPLYYLELCLGQRMRKGSIGVWNEISPYLGGVGFSSVAVCFFVSLYYNVIIAWCIFYFVSSFRTPLPWTLCPREEFRVGNTTEMFKVPECNRSNPTNYFWYRTALDISSKIEESGDFNWIMFLCLACTWFVIWLCMMKGIKVTGKIVYVTATTPLVLLIVLFFCGVHLKGYQEGLALLFIPKFEKLKDPEVWKDAAIQIFYSLGVAYGSLIAFASYNPMKSKCNRDAIHVCLVNCGVSIYASVVVFCFIGFEADKKMEDCLHTQIGVLNSTGSLAKHDLPVEDLYTLEQILITKAKQLNTTMACDRNKFLEEVPAGRAFAFLVITETISKLQYPTLWSIMFFFMLVMIGIDTEFGMLEGVVTPIIDMKIFPKLRREVLSGIVCFICFLFAIMTLFSSGEYWLQFISAHCSDIPLLVIGLVEVLAVSYVYGINRFCDDIKYMTNKSPSFIWILCWKFISPLAILTILITSVVKMIEMPPTYRAWDKSTGGTSSKDYPPWLNVLAVLLILSSIIFIPAFALLNFFGVIKINGRGTIVLLPKKARRTSTRNIPMIRFSSSQSSRSNTKSSVGSYAEHYGNGQYERVITNDENPLVNCSN